MTNPSPLVSVPRTVLLSVARVVNAGELIGYLEWQDDVLEETGVDVDWASESFRAASGFS